MKTGRTDSSELLSRLVAVLLLALLPAFGAGVWLAVTQGRDDERRARQDAQRLAETVAADERAILYSTRDLLGALALVPQVREASAGCDALLASMLENRPVYANFGVIGADGLLRCSALPSGPIDLSDREYFQQAMREQRFAVGGYQIGRVTRRPGINAAYPVNGDGGAPTGVVFAAIDLAWLEGTAAAASLPEGAAILVLDGDGTVLARTPSRPRLIGRSAAGEPVARLALSGRQQTAEVRGLDGVERLYAFSVLGEADAPTAYVAVGIPSRTAFGDAERSLRLSLIALVVGAGLALGAAWLLTRRYVVRPVRQAREEERRAAEASAKLAAIVESSDDAILGKTLEAEITSWNRGAEALYGYSPAEAVGRSVAMLVPPERAGEERRLIDRIRTGERVENYETERVRKDGSRVEVSLTVSPIRGADGAVVGASVIARDITKQKAAERALRESEQRFAQAFTAERQAAERLRELDQLKNDFVAMVAHDLRSPMAVVSGYAEVLQAQADRITPQEREKFLGTIARVCGSMSDLVDQVLQIARIEAGEFQYDIRPVDLVALARRTVDELRSAYGDRFVVRTPGTVPEALADEQRQWQILTNLLSNAAKFSEPDSPIDVTIGRAQDMVRVAVHNAGEPIPPEDLGKLFQRFSRLRQPGRGTEVKGTGLGLYICKRMIEDQGGEIGVDSAPGRGTTFSYTVPAAPPG